MWNIMFGIEGLFIGFLVDVKIFVNCLVVLNVFLDVFLINMVVWLLRKF